MCMVSNIGDGWAEYIPKKYPQFVPKPQQQIILSSEVSRVEFEALRKEVVELKKLLEAAKKFDEATGQPECQMEAKVKLIKEIAKLVGVDLGDVFGDEKKQ
jgi:hypothetical protein